MPRPAKQEVAQNETDENILHEPVEITYPKPEAAEKEKKEGVKENEQKQ